MRPPRVKTWKPCEQFDRIPNKVPDLLNGPGANFPTYTPFLGRTLNSGKEAKRPNGNSGPFGRKARKFQEGKRVTFQYEWVNGNLESEWFNHQQDLPNG